MNRLGQTYLLFLLISLGSQLLPAQSWHNPQEIGEIMQKSDLFYEVLLHEAAPNQRIPGMAPALGLRPQKIGNEIRLKQDTLSPHGEIAFSSGMNALNEANWPLATQRLAECVKVNPDFGPGSTALAFAQWQNGNEAEAENLLRETIEDNFFDSEAHRNLGRVLESQKKYEEALSEMSIAWVLNRNDEAILQEFAWVAKKAGQKFQDWEFAPHFKLFDRGDTISVVAGEPWVAYAACKSVWTFEEDYRRHMTGKGFALDIEEEQECLTNLLVAHVDKKGREKSGIPGIRQLWNAHQAGKMNEFIFFEIWLVKNPVLAYVQPPEVIRSIAEFAVEYHTK